MPTARELLEQAEALMHRDRMAAIRAEDEFPVLTDEVPPDEVPPGEVPPDAATPSPLPETNDDASFADAGPDSLSPLPIDVELPPSRGLPMNDAHALWQDDAAGVPADSGITTPLDGFPLDATLDATRWNLMAEDIRMQVLQRIDLFTDTGLREQLAERLKPIVDRASADLVATINQQVGQILRAYVAEAIEREIEKWRREPR